MAKYLVTGVAGFIASRTAQFLLEQGHVVVGIDNLNDYYDVRLKYYRLFELTKASGGAADIVADLDKSFLKSIQPPDIWEAGNFRFLQLDIEDKGAVLDLFKAHQFDAVLNLAARAGVRYSMENPDVYMTTNTMGTLHLMDGMKATGVKKLVLASTSSLYAGQPLPFKEDLAVNTPISPYAASKKAAEVMAYSYHYLYNVDVSIVRYFTVFGPCGRPDMCIFRFIKWIDEGKPIELFGDGSQSRDFTYIDDIARGTIAALKPLGYEVMNLGGGNNPISLSAIIEAIEGHLGKKAQYDRKPFHKADIIETWANIEKAERLMGWKPKVAPLDGLKNCVDWYLGNKDWLAKIKL
jgi:nucleoside-diphosphate-sugar epimerase